MATATILFPIISSIVTSQYTTIDGHWCDDFNEDPLGVNGWNANVTASNGYYTGVTYGIYNTYHGRFHGAFTLSRSFYCSESVTVYLSAKYIFCGTEIDDSLTMHIGENNFTISGAPSAAVQMNPLDVALTNGTCISALSEFGDDWMFYELGPYWYNVNANELFEVQFIGRMNNIVEPMTIYDISIQCGDQADECIWPTRYPTPPSVNPTYLPTANPTSATANPTYSPSVDPTTANPTTIDSSAIVGFWSDITFQYSNAINDSRTNQWYIYIDRNDDTTAIMAKHDQQPVPTPLVEEGSISDPQYYVFTPDPNDRFRWMRRYFKCKRESTVLIQFDYAYCNAEQADRFKVYHNGNERGEEKMFITANDFSDSTIQTWISNLPTSNLCNNYTAFKSGSFSRELVGDIDGDVQFEVAIRIQSGRRVNYERMSLIYNLNIVCRDTSAPSKSPTLSPTAIPTHTTSDPTRNPPSTLYPY